MSYWPSMKFKHDRDPILSAPNVDIEEYSKLRKKPYPLQSCTNLPYYFLEPETPGPRICSSDLDHIPMHKLHHKHADKLRRMYVCLREECGFKKNLLGEKRIQGYNDELIRVYDCEISGSNFRIQHIKADIVQFMDYIKKVYNLNHNKFNSVTEVALAAALGSSNMSNCFGLATDALGSGANFYLIIWMCFFEFFVVRIQTYFHLTLANYATGTGFTAWGFCPYIRGIAATLLFLEFVSGLSYFFEAPLSLVRAWVAKHNEHTLKICQPSITVDETLGSYSLQKMGFDMDCYSEPNNYTHHMKCPKDELGTTVSIFPSNYFYHLVNEIADLTPETMKVTKTLVYILTFVLWFFLTRKIKNGFNEMLQIMHFNSSLVLIFVSFTFILTATSLSKEVLKEATFAFFSLQCNFFDINVILTAFQHSTMLIIPYLFEFGSALPFHWSPEAVFSWRAITHLSLHFFGMWLAYIGIYHEKSYYKSPDISCFVHKVYILHSAIPRFLNNIGIHKTMASIYYLVDGFTRFVLMSTLLSAVWRNLTHHFGLFKKYPQVIHIYNIFCLVAVAAVMFNVRTYWHHYYIIHRLKYLESVSLSVLVICIDVAVITYYGPPRLWADLEWLTRRRISRNIENDLIITILIIGSVALLGLPKLLTAYLYVDRPYQIVIAVALFVPSLLNQLVIVISDKESSEVRIFHFWGERPYKVQYERFRFNAAQFRTEYLRVRNFTMLDSGDEFYFNQRQKAVIRIAKALKQSQQ